MNLLRWVAIAVFAAGCSGSDPASSPDASTVAADAGAVDPPSSMTGEDGDAGDAGVDGGSDGDPPAPTPAFTVGGTVSGLAGGGLVLTNDVGGTGIDLPINALGSYAFPAQASGSTYSVTVKTPPTSPAQKCEVTNGAGVIGAANVTGVDITCTTRKFEIRGTVTGLTGTGLVLTNNGGDDKAIAADGNFEFVTRITSGQPYLVAVKTQPLNPTQHCVVNKGSGNVGDKPVLDVEITCNRAFYVDAVSGNDAAGDGTPGNPLKTITYAISAAKPSDVPTDIVLAPGTYDEASGESFPILPRSHQTIHGEVGAIISGKGAGQSFSAGDLQADSGTDFTMFFKQGVIDAAIRGVEIDGGDGGIGFDDANVLLDHVTVDNVDWAAIVANGSNVRFVDCLLSSGRHEALLVVDLATKVRARCTTFTTKMSAAITLGDKTPFTGSNVDLGTSAVIGNNTLRGGNDRLGLYLRQSASGSVVQAVGNTWRPNVQGSDAAGKYPASFVDGSSVVVAASGNNYAIDVASAGSGIQF